MTLVKGPNGLVIDMPPAVAEGLIGSPSGEYAEVHPEAEVKPTKRSAVKPSDTK